MPSVAAAVRLAVVGSGVGAADAGGDDVVGFPGVAGTFAFMAEAADSFFEQGLGSSSSVGAGAAVAGADGVAGSNDWHGQRQPGGRRCPREPGIRHSATADVVEAVSAAAGGSGVNTTSVPLGESLYGCVALMGTSLGVVSEVPERRSALEGRYVGPFTTAATKTTCALDTSPRHGQSPRHVGVLDSCQWLLTARPADDSRTPDDRGF